MIVAYSSKTATMGQPRRPRNAATAGLDDISSEEGFTWPLVEQIGALAVNFCGAYDLTLPISPLSLLALTKCEC
jgi:hypothetical protein